MDLCITKYATDCLHADLRRKMLYALITRAWCDSLVVEPWNVIVA